jgi:hypothetical protein
MFRPYLALVLLSAAAAASCNSDSARDVAGECSMADFVDDIDDSVEDSTEKTTR